MSNYKFPMSKTAGAQARRLLFFNKKYCINYADFRVQKQHLQKEICHEGICQGSHHEIDF